jgi:peptide/nickel transport system substrate-binding protein
MRRGLTLILLGIACLIETGCGGAPGEATGTDAPVDYADGGTFTMAVANDPGTFDPHRSRGVLGLSALAYDSLVNQLPDGTFVSGLAEQWTVDARSATFTLRHDVTCSDGAALTASMVVASITWVSDPANGSPQYGVNTPTVPLTVTGDDTSGTVTVTAQTPYGFLLHTVGRIPIVCSTGMTNPEIFTTASDGTGPFVLTEAKPGQSYTFDVRDDYTWGPDGASTTAPGTPDKVVLRVIDAETTAANLLLSGEINLAKILGEDHRRLEASGLKKQDWMVGGAWLSFNQRARVTADPRVRQALVSSLDLDEVLRVSTGGTGSTPDGLLALEPKACPGDTVAGQLPTFDLAAAEAALDEAGWIEETDGTRRKAGEPLIIDLHYATTQSLDKPTAELLAQKWRALGIEVTISADTYTSSLATLYETSNWDVFISGYNFSLPSQMVPYLSGATPPDGNNVSGIDNQEYNTLADQAAALTPPEACEYWSQAEQAIVRDVDLAPISNRAEHWFFNKAEAQIQRYGAPVPTSIRVLD